ncbi:MAG: type II toxin-antitoxin system RelB/DinJ family antitoxin [Kiritimatiellae bacterium]|nr:type II toxin-antitoxin system RelB/DinJ family antitoxin [Kiritimatiellia bacterium]
MTTVAMTMRASPIDKRLFEEVCAEIGLSVNAALNVFVKRVARERRIPFELSADPFFGESNMRRLRASAEAARAGRVAEHELVEA